MPGVRFPVMELFLSFFLDLVFPPRPSPHLSGPGARVLVDIWWVFFMRSYARVGGRGRGWVAERSKALVSGTSLFGGTGSNPVPIT